MPVLRRQLDGEAARRLGAAMFAASEPSGLGCPSCNRTMAAVTVDDDGDACELDVCRTCALVWFDPGELEGMPAAVVEPRPEPDDGLTPELRQKMAIAEVKHAIEQQRRDELAAGPKGLAWLPAILGMPVEVDGHELAGLPWATWSLALVVSVVSIAGFEDRDLMLALAFVPDEFSPLSLLSAFFVHGDWLHLIGNMWFLVVFGDNVELHYGRARWAIVVVGATLLGSLLHFVGDPGSTVPCVGASGGISGLIVCYALTLPHARLGILLIHPYTIMKPGGWITFSARTGLVAWFLLQVWIAAEQLTGFGNVSALAHLGGAAVGVLAWLVWRVRDPEPGGRPGRRGGRGPRNAAG